MAKVRKLINKDIFADDDDADCDCDGDCDCAVDENPPILQFSFTDYQLQTLERNFEKQKYLSKQDYQELAAKLNLTDTQVKTWYKNRRAKWNRDCRLAEAETRAEAKAAGISFFEMYFRKNKNKTAGMATLEGLKYGEEIIDTIMKLLRCPLQIQNVLTGNVLTAAHSPPPFGGGTKQVKYFLKALAQIFL